MVRGDASDKLDAYAKTVYTALNQSEAGYADYRRAW